MSTPIKITNLTLRAKASNDVHYFYLNVVFKVLDPKYDFLLNYLQTSQKEYTPSRIYRTYEDIARPVTLSSVEEYLDQINQEHNNEDLYYNGWDFNKDYGWFTYIEKFDCWRFHEFFTDNLVTRSLVNALQKISYGVPTTSRHTEESELIAIFESLKHWWD